MSVRILSLLPQLLDVNGDAENALVLRQRARWSGIDADILEHTAELPDAIVIGSGFEADVEQAAAELRERAELLSAAVQAGVPVLAVATGFELLSSRLEISAGEWIEGLGLLPGRAPLAEERIAGDLVVESGFGTLAGFENHPRRFEPDAGLAPLGHVTFGVGNGAGSSQEGAVLGSIIGTHLHGPVLARNPALADELLRRIAGEAYHPDNARARSVDRWAELSKSKLLKRVKAG